MYHLLPRAYPLFLPLTSYILGIVIDYHYSFDQVRPLVWVLLVLFLGLILTFTIKSGKKYSHRYLFGISISIAFLVIGIISHQIHSMNLFTLDSEYSPAVLKVEEYPLEGQNTYAVTTSWLQKETSLNLGRLRLYFEKDHRVSKLVPGNLILIKQLTHPKDAILNPGEFNFKRYLESKRIHGHKYVRATEWRLWKSKEDHTIFTRAWEIRLRLLRLITNWEVDAETKALTTALVLGDKKAIAKDTREAYSSAGGMHVLAVSGLHTGIFYLILSLLFKPIKSYQAGRIISTMLIITTLWIYALVTGFSASVVRAVSMFSLLAIGSGMKRSPSIYNTLIASAFILLLCQPGFLFQVGFQLSFAALLGIVSIYPIIKPLGQPKQIIWQKVWDIICVSVAAQIGTLPLVIYYFHQFPTLFLLTNLFVIPLVSLIMYTAFVCLLLSGFSIPVPIAFKVLEFLTNTMNSGVKMVHQSNTTLQGLILSPLLLILFYIILVLIFRWWVSGRFKIIQICFVVMCIFFSISLLHLYQRKRPTLIVYHTNKSFAIGAFRDRKGVLIAGSEIIKDTALQQYRFGNHWMMLGIKHPRLIEGSTNRKDEIYKSDPSLLKFENQLCFLYSGQDLPRQKVPHWIIIKDIPPPESYAYKPQKIILTAAVSTKIKQRWIIWAGNSKIWDIEKQGAYILGQDC